LRGAGSPSQREQEEGKAGETGRAEPEAVAHQTPSRGVLKFGERKTRERKRRPIRNLERIAPPEMDDQRQHAQDEPCASRQHH